jgi:hypothetical protein
MQCKCHLSSLPYPCSTWYSLASVPIQNIALQSHMYEQPSNRPASQKMRRSLTDVQIAHLTLVQVWEVVLGLIPKKIAYLSCEAFSDT